MGRCICTIKPCGRTVPGKGIQSKHEPDSAHTAVVWICPPSPAPCTPPHLHLHPRVLTCELLHGLQPDPDALVGEQRGGGQRARHALHHANVLHALRHGEWGHSVVSLEGTVAVYAATFRTGGDTRKQSKVINFFI